MFTVYGKPGCPYCTEAIKLLEDSSYSYRYVDISEDKGAREYVVSLGVKTVPQVFHSDNHVGGYDELSQYMMFDD